MRNLIIALVALALSSYTLHAQQATGRQRALDVSFTPGANVSATNTQDAIDEVAGDLAATAGDVLGPASSTTEAIAVFDDTTGKRLKNTPVTISATGDIAGADNLEVTNLVMKDSDGSHNYTFVPANLSAAANINWPAGSVTIPAGILIASGGALGTPSSGDGGNLTNLDGANIQTDTIGDAAINYGTGAGQVNAADEPTVTTSFDQRLSGSDTTIQAALDTLDDYEDVQCWIIPITDRTSDLTASTSTPVEEFYAPFAVTVTAVKATVGTAPTGSGMTIDIHAAGSTIMATNKISIDIGGTRSVDAGTQPTLTTTAIADGALIDFFLDAVGSTETGKAVKVYIYWKKQ